MWRLELHFSTFMATYQMEVAIMLILLFIVIKESNIDINSLYSLLSKEIADKVYSLIQKKQSFKVADFMIIFK